MAIIINDDNKKCYRSIMLVLSLCLTSCSTNINFYQEKRPAFSMDEFFQGDLCAKGLVRNRDKSVNRKFIASIQATTDLNQVILDENFIFDDGEKQSRYWVFNRSGSQWLGSAGDVVGQAVGEVAGDTLHLRYQLKINVDQENIVFDIDDWLHLVDPNTLMGSATISKWGINVGQIDIVIEKQNQTISPDKLIQKNANHVKACIS